MVTSGPGNFQKEGMGVGVPFRKVPTISTLKRLYLFIWHAVRSCGIYFFVALFSIEPRPLEAEILPRPRSDVPSEGAIGVEPGNTNVEKTNDILHRVGGADTPS
jgi:hypothetical protein